MVLVSTVLSLMLLDSFRSSALACILLLILFRFYFEFYALRAQYGQLNNIEGTLVIGTIAVCAGQLVGHTESTGQL